MMNRKAVRLLAGALGVGSLGWLGGGSYQKYKHRPDSLALADKPLLSAPGLPLEATVSTERSHFLRVPSVNAASAIVPAVQDSGLAIPAKDTGVPSEPHPEAPRVSQIMRFGFPGLDHIRSHQDYILSYDRRNRVPHWVFEHLTPASCRRAEDVDRTKSEFREDTSIHPYFRSKNTDYKYSGFDRGHIAAAGNHMAHQTFMDETFLLSNMAPQVGRGFNRDKWEHLERYVRKLTKLYRNVYCCSGPLYLPRMEEDGKSWVKYQVIGQNNVAVPTHFFKILVMETDSGQLELESFVLPNEEIPDSTPLDNFRVPPESVERAAGLLFFDRLSREKLAKINGQKTGGGWF